MPSDELTSKEKESLVFEEIKRISLEEGRQLIAQENNSALNGALNRFNIIGTRAKKNKYQKFTYAFCHFNAVKKYFDLKYGLNGECFTIEMLEEESYKDLLEGTKLIIQKQIQCSERAKEESQMTITKIKRRQNRH